MRVLGIDPGFSGALAVVEFSPVLDRAARAIPERQHPKVSWICDMPVRKVTRNGRNAHTTDYKGLARAVFDATHLQDASGVIIEAVHTMPRDGKVSAGRFMENFGAVQGAVAASGTPVALVRPEVWKASMGLTSDKEMCRQHATQLFGTDEHWPLKKHNGRAEAALLAWYGIRTTTGA
jgi:crossover junction endodeoxyribonuclease RuvC